MKKCWHSNPTYRPSFNQMLQENIFDESIIETLIPEENTLGRMLWKNYFFGKWIVTWDEFVNAFSLIQNSTNFTQIDQQCLKIILRVEETNGVAIENFSALLEWFGPFNDSKFLERIKDLLKKNYFFGYINQKYAEDLLKSEKKGSFLVRFSKSQPGCYTISIITRQSEIRHFRIYYQAITQKFKLFSCTFLEEYNSLEEVLTSKKIKEIFNIELNLKKPCSFNSPFQKIFEKDKKKNFNIK
jgi:hypothetical protein